MPHRAHRALLLILTLGVTVWCTFLLCSEERELKTSEEALRHVISWRQKMITASGTGGEVEILCSEQGSIHSISDNVQRIILSCNELLQGRSVYPLPQLNSLANSNLSKGHIEVVDGTQCQEWTTAPAVVGRYVQPPSTHVEEVCIGVNDHLPRRVKYHEAEYVFYDWKVRPTK
jgi:hypothetical protein